MSSSPGTRKAARPTSYQDQESHAASQEVIVDEQRLSLVAERVVSGHEPARDRQRRLHDANRQAGRAVPGAIHRIVNLAVRAITFARGRSFRKP